MQYVKFSMVASLLWSILLPGISGQEPEARIALEQKGLVLAERVFNALAVSSFEVKGRKEYWATVGSGGRSTMLYVHPAAPYESDRVGQMAIVTSWAFKSPTLVDKKKLAKWAEAQEKFTVQGHRTTIDGSTQLSFVTYLPEEAPATVVAQKVRELWAGDADFFRTVLPKDSKPAPVNSAYGKPLVGDDFPVSELCPDDYRILVDHWGWAARGGGGTGSGWGVTLSIDGRFYWLSGRRPEGNGVLPKPILLSCQFGNAAWGTYWSENPPKFSWARVDAHPESAPYLRVEVDLSSPKTIKMLREEIASFVTNVKKLVEDTPVNPPTAPPVH